MFRLFNRTGWEKLPKRLLQDIQQRLEDDFHTLDSLAITYNLFKQEYFRQTDYSDSEMQIDMLAILVGTLGDQLSKQGKFAPAEAAYHVSLKLKGNHNPAIASLAILYAITGNSQLARIHAEDALDLLFQSPEIRHSETGRELQLRLARIVSDGVLKECLEDATFQNVQLHLQNWQPTTEQQHRLALAYLSMGGPNHQEGLDYLRTQIADILVDIVDHLAHHQIQNMQEQSLEVLSTSHVKIWEARSEIENAATLAIAATVLEPNNIDAWVLASNMLEMGVLLGGSFKKQAFEFSLEALERIEDFLNGNSHLHSKNPALTHRHGNVHQVTKLLLKTLRANANEMSKPLLDRASKFLE
jgi:hypothetical protein